MLGVVMAVSGTQGSGLAHSLLWKVKNFRLKRIASGARFKAEDALIICANPRGGSTWLFEMLVDLIPDSATVLEPLHRDWVTEVRDLQFDWHQRIGEEEEWGEARDLFERILSGRMLTAHTCENSPIDDYRTASRLLLKFVRLNGMLPWLTKQFQFKYKPIVLTRHPIAVAVSMARHPQWQSMPDHYVFPKSPYVTYSDADRAYLETLSTKEEVMVAKWCTRNRGLLYHSRRNKDWMVFHYEDLVVQPGEALAEIAKSWDFDLKDQSQIDFNKASRSSVETTFATDSKVQLEKWRSRVEPDMLNRMLATLSYFEIDLYGDDPYPNKGSGAFTELKATIS